MLLHCYYFSDCQSCSMQKQCTTGKERRVKRWEHEAVIDAMQARLEHDPGKMKVRRQTVEHPFGTLKYWMGAGSRELATLEWVDWFNHRRLLGPSATCHKPRPWPFTIDNLPSQPKRHYSYQRASGKTPPSSPHQTKRQTSGLPGRYPSAQARRSAS